MNDVLYIRGDYASFWCPGCDNVHTVIISGTGAWGFNGSTVAPTLTPSVKVTWPANPNASDDFAEWRTERVCHSFVTDGKIQFLNDCTHRSAGMTLELSEFPEDWE